MRDLIVNLHVGHPNNIESARSSRETFAKFGYRLMEISLNSPRAPDELAALMRDHQQEIFFFMSSNYYASKVIGEGGLLLHRLTGIPLVVMMHDHPLYFLSEHTPQFEGTIAFAVGEGARSFIEKHFPPGTRAIANTGSLPQLADEEPDFEQFKSRHNMILAPMNLHYAGLSLDGLWLKVKTLPEPRRALAVRLTEAALTDCATPLHEIAAGLDYNLSLEDAALAIGDQLLVLNFVKMWRRHYMVRALIDLPILISSEFVPADLELRYPGKFTLFSMAETIPLYRQYRFTLNSHPLITHILHDRVLTATAANSACITDANAAVRRYFHDGVDALFFDYTDGVDMVARIAPYFDDPAKAFDLTVRAAQVRIETGYFGYVEGYSELIAAVAEHWASAT